MGLMRQTAQIGSRGPDGLQDDIQVVWPSALEFAFLWLACVSGVQKVFRCAAQDRQGAAWKVVFVGSR